MDSGQVKPKFIILRVKDQLVKQKCHIFCAVYIFGEKKRNWAPGSGAAGIQVVSGQVKT